MATSSRSCFICQQRIEADDLAFQHHLNQCLDNPTSHQPIASSSRASSSSSESMHDAVAEDERVARALAASLDEEVAFNLAATLNGNGDGDGDHGGGLRLGWSGGGEVGVESCPSCLRDWRDLGMAGADGAGREIHVEMCLNEKSQLMRDEGDWGGGIEGNDDLNGLGKRGFSTSGSGSGSGRGGFGTSVDRKHVVVGSPGLIPIIATALSLSHKDGRTRAAYLCSTDVQHIGTQWVDFGWGCGYRNFQMIFSSLMKLPNYHSAFKKIPTLPEIQDLVEAGWKNGLDPLGAKHFHGKLQGKKNWVGTTDMWVALTWMGIKAKIVDFPHAGRFSFGAHLGLVEWVESYFTAPVSPSPFSSSSSSSDSNAFDTLMKSGGTPITFTEKQPLYLQHQGHSRTIVGLEVTKKDKWLLIFDPSKRPSKSQKAAGLNLASTSSSSSSDDPSEPAQKKFKPTPSLEKMEKSTSAFWDQAPGKDRIWHGKGKKSGSGGGGVESPTKALEGYRVSLNSLSKREDYQILYALDEPLMTRSERNQIKGAPTADEWKSK